MTERTSPTGRLGAVALDTDRWTVEVWAPLARRVEFEFESGRRVAFTPTEHGYFTAVIEGRAGDRYWLVLDGVRRLADPVSRRQPDGVHGPSALFDPDEYRWLHDFSTPPTLRDLVLYELHVGTFTAAGTFDAAIADLGRLAALGITAVEPMPVASFPGRRNWGYDGVFPFAVQESYGGPSALQRFVDAAHGAGLAVVLDVVYNHLGPEGSVHGQFGPYTTTAYATPWGPGMNVDHAGSDEVRRYFIENALMWFTDFRVDGLRLDAIHGIIDTSARPFLAELADAVARRSTMLGRPLLLIAESADNNPRVIRDVRSDGYGMDAQWCDDFHHALHVALTGEHDGYYADFQGANDLAVALAEGFVYQGQYSAFRGRRHGAPPKGSSPTQFVVSLQNHDQVGNRAAGDRLSTLVGTSSLEVGAAALLLGPNVPLLFMGEEYGERAPFPYFVDHGDPELIAAVRRGRAEEFGSEDVADPASPSTFDAAVLDRRLLDHEAGAGLASLYRRLLELRRSIDSLTDPDARAAVRCIGGQTVVLERTGDHDSVFVGLHFADSTYSVDLPPGRWILDLGRRARLCERTLEFEGLGFACLTRPPAGVDG